MLIRTSEIVDEANRIIDKCNSHDPLVIAEKLGIQVIERDFKQQLGAYKPVLGIPFIFIKADIDAALLNIVLLHEIGHHVLHKDMVENGAVFLESELFNTNNKMEFEANIFAAEISLPDDEFLELAQMGFNVDQIANAMNSNKNLVALKVEILNNKGYKLQKQSFNKKFLK